MTYCDVPDAVQREVRRVGTAQRIFDAWAKPLAPCPRVAAAETVCPPYGHYPSNSSTSNPT